MNEGYKAAAEKKYAQSNRKNAARSSGGKRMMWREEAHLTRRNGKDGTMRGACGREGVCLRCGCRGVECEFPMKFVTPW